MTAFRFVAVGLGLVVLTGARAQWTVVSLHPAGATESRALGVDGGQQVGEVAMSGPLHASLWLGTAASWVDLNPMGDDQPGAANAVWAGQQMGWVGGNYHEHASVWSGSSASWQSLEPGPNWSFIFGGGEGKQAGVIPGTFPWHAALWSGSASSVVDLQPMQPLDFVLYSFAYDTDRSQQVGSAYLDGVGVTHAFLWRGTAGSWVDLYPDLSINSEAYGVSSGQQVGYVGTHASLWRGSAVSWVDLHPSGAEWSSAYATDGERQVGYARIGGTDHAGLWSGTSATWFDLSTFLPAGFNNSRAKGIAYDANHTYVVGFAHNTITDKDEAFLWIGPRYLWTVLNLHPAGADSSRAYALDDKQQVGFVEVGGHMHGSVWRGRASSWVDLHPSTDYQYSIAYAVDGERQVGEAQSGNRAHAVMWSGTVGTFSDLNWAIQSAAYGISGLKIGGWYGGDNARAALWTVGAPPCDALQLAGDISMVYGIEGNRKVGFTDYNKACMWIGTANTAVNLHPAGGEVPSAATSISEPQQGGFITILGSHNACLWTGSASSVINLHPLAATSSEVHGIHKGVQVGEATVDGHRHASFWVGTAVSWDDLHTTLGTNYDESVAFGVRRIGNTVRVVGFAHNTVTNRDEAVMWTKKLVFGPPSR